MSEKQVDVEAILNPRHELNTSAYRLAASLVYAIARVRTVNRPQYLGLDKVRANQTTLYMANHQIPEDIPLVDRAVARAGGSRPLSFAAAEKYWKPNLFGFRVGRAMEMAGAVAVIRPESSLPRETRALAAGNYVEKTASYIGRGVSAAIFPEGSRYPIHEHRIRRIQPGGFRVAAETRVPIQPISIAYRQHNENNRLDAVVAFGDLIDPPDSELPLQEQIVYSRIVREALQDRYNQGLEVLGISADV
ncbi:MAG: lysophospholipid acyltransferase family protein [Candidatus Saccharimonadales bacterium]|nr:lysophospholipid acyltransferase family protein [Candidatus Saccharimonadales bacterium]